ncbi:GNAT family N-acetyltransferase [Pseudoalteromonas sp. DL2-H2.2]|uniref:GNAT family N-acetyltransferase n=1 Tax=Pseudoalteromonas sp. DL2-H2.2 TaxID=2908889 RepID=UPI001F41914F|nr:GNAT family N-acetyltransferase [Pseudoalteromonas sp. DL2-H2.2]MCF2910070.1 GNAT family N-acetyltransferase [Pseudoalteromonas sp. DL2-H2.2]
MSIKVSSDKTLLDVDVIHNYISERSYWGQGRTKDQVLKSIDNSICFGLYVEGSQVAFARVVTDAVCCAYLLDLFVLEEHRGKGYSKQILEAVFAHPELQTVSCLLRTADAQGLYQQFGFEPVGNQNDFMRRSA